MKKYVVNNQITAKDLCDYKHVTMESELKIMRKTRNTAHRQRYVGN